MRNTPFSSIPQLQLLPAMALVAVAALAQRPSPIDAALRDLASADLPSRGRGLTALLQQSRVDARGGNATRVAVVNLLHSHAAEADRIKSALIAALERHGTDFEQMIKEGHKPQGEGFNEDWMSLTQAVSALQDPRAVKGLILALPAGSEEGLADICPAAVDAIIQRSHEPDLYWQGIAVEYPSHAVWTLGWCLQRPALMRENPAVEGKIRGELLADLDHKDWGIRTSAAFSLSALSADPEVQTKLQVVAGSDPYFEKGPPNGGSGRFTVREAAARALDSQGPFSFYVTRTSETRSCRIQQASEPVTGERIIGPDLRDSVRRTMCSHYDPTSQDLSWCWRVEPLNACMQ